MPVQRVEVPLSQASIVRGRWFARARPSESCLQFATIHRLDAFEALGPEWDDLFASCGQAQQAFQSFAWLRLWAKLYVDGGTRLSVVTARSNGRLIGVWPLVARRMLGLRILMPMGEPLTQYCDALISPELDACGEDAMLDHVLGSPVDAVSFHRVRDDAAIAPLLRRRFGDSTNRQQAPFVALGGVQSADGFALRFSGKVRSSRRRRLRRLEERGSVSFLHHGPGDAAAEAIAVAFTFKRDWARRAGIVSPSLRDPRFERFFIDAATAGPRAPDLRVSVLKCGDETMGVEISLACRGRLIGHVLAPRPDLVTLGLGGVLAEQTILGALAQGFESLDLLAPADPYKLDWTSNTVGVGDYNIANGALGAIYTHVWLKHGREAAKALACRLRPALARFQPGRPSSVADTE